MPKAPWIAATLTAGYLLGTAVVVRLFSANLPAWLEQALSVLILPAVFLISLWSPVLKRLGWTDGDWFVVPSAAGLATVVLFYTGLAYLLVALVVRWRRR